MTKRLTKLLKLVEEVHLVGDDKSSTDEIVDLIENAIQHDESEDGSEYESAQEMSDAEDDILI